MRSRLQGAIAANTIAFAQRDAEMEVQFRFRQYKKYQNDLIFQGLPALTSPDMPTTEQMIEMAGEWLKDMHFMPKGLKKLYIREFCIQFGLAWLHYFDYAPVTEAYNESRRLEMKNLFASVPLSIA